MKNKLLSILLTICMVALLLPVKLFTLEARAESGEQAVYDLISEVPTVDGGQATNCGAEYDYDKLVDGNTSTKYYLSNADPWVEFHYSQAFVPKQYVLWTAFDTNNDSNRNPASWTIKAKLNKTDAWTTIATAENSGSNQLPTGNTQSKVFSIVENENAYKYFRFEATRQSNHVQLGELQFKEATPKVELTWNMSDQSSMQYTISGNSADFVSNGNTMRYTWTGTPGWNLWGSAGNYLFHKAIENQLQVTFPYLTGKVTKVEINNINFSPSGMSLSVSNGTANLKNGNSDYFASTDDTSGSSVTFTGEIDVNTSNYLRFTFVKTASGNVSNQRFDFMNNGSIKVTLVKEQKADLGHTFTTSSITANGNVLTAICTSDDADHNTLYGGAGHQYTLTLNAADGMASYMNPVNASITPSVGDFNEDTGLGATCIVEYAPQGTSNWTTSAPATPGNYTARATVRINSTDYVLTANFSVIEGHYITNNNPQQLSVNKTGALEGESITVTFTPKMGESVATLTVTGDTTSLSIGSGITDNGDNTYTFAMPNEDVTIAATFNFPANSNFTQDGNTYIIKNADGWDYFCQRMRYDANLDGFSGKTIELAANISVTKMAGMVHPFKGTFDGKGKALTFNPTEVGMYTAPFQNTDGATICNLHVTGLIEGGTNSYLGGLVGSAEGNLTIRDCHVSTQISTTFDSNTLSSNVGIGGIVGYVHYTNYDEYCRITGTVYDGLIYNPNYSGSTYGCGGFVGCLSEYGHVDLTDCLFIEGQYDNNGGKHELLWGHDNNMNSTFFHRTNNQGYGTLKNCFFVATHFLKQGSPAVESTDAPDNFAHFGDPTDHRFMQTYGHTMVFNGKYYTPIYGDLVENYDYSGVKGYNIEYDDAPLGIPDITSPLWTDVLRYNRSFTKDKPVIVMLPFNFTKDNITLAHSSQHPSGHFYSFAGVTGWAPVMESANEVTSMTANTPYLYVPGEDTEYLVFYLYDGFYIFTAGNNGGDKTAVSGDWTLTGTYTGKTWTEAEQDFGRTFILNNSGELTDVTDTTIVKPTDGYFVISVNTYTVTFDANGGTGTIAAETVTGGATYTLPACTFTAPEGKTFFAWSVKIGDAEAVNKNPNDTIEVTADTTVKALWKAAKPSFAAHSLVLSGQIGVNFFMDLRALSDAERVGTYMTFTISGAGSVPSEPVYFDANLMNSDLTYHKFTCYVNSIQMADTITATYHWFEDGVEKTVSEDYSIKQYISAFDAKKESFDATTVALVHALADYGHYVQIFLDANNDNWSVGKDYAEMDLHFANSYDIDTIKTAVSGYAIDKVNNTGGDIETITYSLVLDSETAIKVYFKPSGDYTGTPTVTVGDQSYTATKTGGRYVVVIPKISAHQLINPHTIVFTTTNGTATVTVSALSYVKGALNYYSDADSQNAMAAIYAYSKAAQDFIAAH